MAGAYTGYDDMVNQLSAIKTRQANRKRQAAEHDALFQMNTGGPSFAGGLGTAGAPSSGYLDERDYINGLRDDAAGADIESLLAGKGGVNVVGRYPSAGGFMRPSMSALGSYDPNLREIPMTFDQRRQAAMLGEQDARVGQELARDAADADAAADINSGRLTMRARAAGEAQGAGASAVRQAANEQYFDPTEKARRSDELAQRMEELRRRYTDPAIVKAQTDIEAARIRAAGGLDREYVRGSYGLGMRELQNTGNLDVARTRGESQIGAQVAAAGGDPTPYRPSTADRAPMSGRTMSTGELARFAADQGITLEEAQRLADLHGYQVVR